MEQQPVVTAVSESPVTSTVEVSTPAPQPAIVEQRVEQHVEKHVEPRVEQREEPRAQAFVAEAPAQVAAPVPVPEPVAAPQAAVPVEAPVPVSTVRETAPRADPKELLSSSGLVMIETDPSRAKSYVLEEERVQLGRPRRERPKQSTPEELMQVETKN